TIHITINAAVSGIISADSEVTVDQVTPALKLSINVRNSGGKSFRTSVFTRGFTTAGGSGQTVAGFGRIQPVGSTAPSGLAIFAFRQNDVLVTEASVPAMALIRTGRIYAEINGPVNTGLAIANPNSQPATISFYFTGASGNFHGSTTIVPANGQIAAFLDQLPFEGGSSLSGTFSFSA